MNEYVKLLEDIEKQRIALESQTPTLEIQKQIEMLNSEASNICAKYLQELEAYRENSLSALKAQEDDLRKLLFNLRMRQIHVGKYPESEACIQNAKQIKVVRRELARIKFDIRERGKIK